MLNEFYRTLSIRGTNFIACWAYWEPISSHAEHARKCLKVEYLDRIEYNFQKSRVTGPWDVRFRFLQKSIKKISCLCTFNRMRAMSLSTLPVRNIEIWYHTIVVNTKVFSLVRLPYLDRCFIFFIIKDDVWVGFQIFRAIICEHTELGIFCPQRVPRFLVAIFTDFVHMFRWLYRASDSRAIFFFTG